MTDIIVKRGTTVRYKWDVRHPETGALLDVTDGDYEVSGNVRAIAGQDSLFEWTSEGVDSNVVLGVGYVQIELTEDDSLSIGTGYSRAVYQLLMRKVSSDEVTEIDSGKLLFEPAVAEWL